MALINQTYLWHIFDECDDQLHVATGVDEVQPMGDLEARQNADGQENGGESGDQDYSQSGHSLFIALCRK